MQTKGTPALSPLISRAPYVHQLQVHGKESVNPRSAPDMHASSSGAGGRDYSAGEDGLMWMLLS
jgi:hypothetical protein